MTRLSVLAALVALSASGADAQTTLPPFCSAGFDSFTFTESQTLTLSGTPGDSVRVLFELRGADGGDLTSEHVAYGGVYLPQRGGAGAVVRTPYDPAAVEGGIWLPTGGRLDVYVGQPGSFGGGGGGSALVIDQSRLIAVAAGGGGPATNYGGLGGRGFGPSTGTQISGGSFNTGRPGDATLTYEGGGRRSEYPHDTLGPLVTTGGSGFGAGAPASIMWSAGIPALEIPPTNPSFEMGGGGGGYVGGTYWRGPFTSPIPGVEPPPWFIVGAGATSYAADFESPGGVLAVPGGDGGGAQRGGSATLRCSVLADDPNAEVGPPATVAGFDLLVDTVEDQPYLGLESRLQCADRTLDGDCSLREAIEVANYRGDLLRIGFEITEDHGLASDGTATLRPTSPLPALARETAFISGETQPGWVGATETAPAQLKVVLDGSAATGETPTNGLTLEGRGSAVAGLVVGGFSGNGIALHSGAESAVVAGNHVGIGADGATPMPNGQSGVYVNARGATVGGGEGSPHQRNVISGNGEHGVGIVLTDYSGGWGPILGISVRGNYIGTDAAGTAAVPNGSAGIFSYYVHYTRPDLPPTLPPPEPGGVTTTVAGNVISGNGCWGVHGQRLSRMTLQDNVIGLGVDGATPLGNGCGGFHTVDPNRWIEGNVVSANDGPGLYLGFPESKRVDRPDVIRANRIGTDAEGRPGAATLNSGAAVVLNDTWNVEVSDNVIASGGEGVRLEYARTVSLVGSRIGGPSPLGVASSSVPAAPTFTAKTLESIRYTATAAPGATVRFELLAAATGGALPDTLVWADAVADGSGVATATLDIGDLESGTLLTARTTVHDAASPSGYGPTSAYSPAVRSGGLVVTKLADTDDGTCDADCSLREALAAVEPGELVAFAAELDGQTLTVASPLVPPRSVAIDASALPNGLSVSGGDAVRVFEAASGTLILRGLVVRDGAAEDGAGLYVRNGAEAVVEGVRFTSNAASRDGGGVYAEGGTFTARQSSFDANTSRWGAAVYANGSAVTLASSSVVGNAASESAAVLGQVGFNAASGKTSAVRLEGSTVAENTSGGTGVSGVWALGSGTTVALVSTVVASASTDPDCESGGGGSVSLSYAHIEDGTCGATSAGDPVLVSRGATGPLGAPVWGPGAMSPLLDAGTCAVGGAPALSADLRGVRRPVDQPLYADADDGCDIGAVEATREEAPGQVTASVTLDGVAGWRMLSAPQDTTMAAFLSDLWTQGFPGADDPDAACTVFAFDEAGASFAESWTCLADGEATTPAGTGVMVYVFEDDDPRATAPGTQNPFPKTLTSAAPIDPGPFDYTVRFVDDGRSFAQKGWNLLGNPSGAAVSWARMARDGVRSTVYVYDPAFNGGDYRTATVDGGMTYGDLPGGEIPPFQGFFVHALRAGAGLSAGSGDYEPGGDAYGRQAAAPVVRIALSDASGERSAAFVALSETGALGPDAADAARLMPLAWPRAVVYTTALGDDAPLVANALPADLGGEVAVEVPLGVDAAGFGGEVALKLSATAEALPEGWRLVLVDRQTGAVHPLTTPYAFTADGGASARTAAMAQPAALAGDGEPRFALRLASASAVATEGAQAVETVLQSVAPNPTRGSATVTWTLADAGEARVAVYDLLGREVAVLADGPLAAGAHRAEVPAGLAPGVYVVRLAAGSAVDARRVTVVR